MAKGLMERYIQELREEVDRFLKSYFESLDSPHKKLHEAVRYSLLAGGKRIRPILTLASFRACSGKNEVSKELQESVMRVAAGLEMIHTYSLIHDDLPAMDNDDLRRGRPTNHKTFGEAIAILAGDSLLTDAFLVMSRGSGVNPKILLEVIGDIADASGSCGMAGGQALDLDYERRKITARELEELHRHKTGRLIEVAVTSGAKLAGGSAGTSEDKLNAIKKYGKAIGLSFQIADDILDVEGGAEEMGKATGGDAKKEKATYPAILGLDESKRLASGLTEQALDSLKMFGDSADILRYIARYIVSRRK